jgi:hypothetical protein
MRVEDVPFPKPGLLYWLYGSEDRTEGTYVSVFVADGCVVERLVFIGLNGPELIEDISWGEADGQMTLEPALAGLYADQVWRYTGVKVGRYADDPVIDLEVDAGGEAGCVG